MQNFLSRKHAFFRLPLFKLRAYAEGVTDEERVWQYANSA